MRHRFHFLPLALVLASGLRCGDGPTQPGALTPTPIPTPNPTPAPPDLNGEWTGTFVGGSCTTPEEINVRLSHVDGRVRGFFSMSCLSTHSTWVELDGTYGGSFPRVWLNVNDQHACLLSGVAASSTSFTAWSRSSNLCVGARLRLFRQGG